MLPLRVAFTSELFHLILSFSPPHHPFLPTPVFFLASRSDAYGSPLHPEYWDQRRSKIIGGENCCSSLLEEGTLEKFLEGQKLSGGPCGGGGKPIFEIFFPLNCAPICQGMGGLW